jgi:hypothetical protein
MCLSTLKPRQEVERVEKTFEESQTTYMVLCFHVGADIQKQPHATRTTLTSTTHQRCRAVLRAHANMAQLDPKHKIRENP